MGLLDRFRKAAGSARDALEERGILPDDDEVHPVAPMEPHEHDLQAVDQAIALGAPDPFTLVSREDVVEVTGVAFGGPSLSYSDDHVGVRFDARDGHQRNWSVGVNVAGSHEFDDRFDPNDWYASVVARLDDAIPVEGVGDEAVYEEGLLYVRGAGRALFVQIDTPKETPRFDWAVALARVALGRLAGSPEN